MQTNREKLVAQLRQLPDVTVDFWKDTQLLCVNYKGKEVAHFQSETELDIRLTPSIIKRKGLQPPPDTTSHPDRSKNSRWIVQSFADEADIAVMVSLIQLAVTL